MLAELKEADARGETARIFEEMRHLTAVPFVSSMQRHLATRPGWLEWAWAAIGPAFRSGVAQETGWRLTADLPLAPLPKPSPAMLEAWGVDTAAATAIGAVCDSFIRVAPTNLVFAGLLRRLLNGEQPGGATPRADWTPPAMLPPLPKPVDVATLDDANRAVVMQFAADVGGQPFVPSLYRMIGQWPSLLAYLAEHLVPHFTDPATRAAGEQMAERIDAGVPDVLATLPPLPATPPMPPEAEHAAAFAAFAAYRKTSPQMVMFSRLIRGVLPA